MATILPPTPASGSTTGVNAVGGANLQALGEVVVEQVPERIANLPRTIMLTGTVVDRQEGGALVLRTQVGEVIIRSQTPLPTDRIIALQIPPGAPPVRALVSVVQPNVPAPATATAAPLPLPVPATTTTPAVVPPVVAPPAVTAPVAAPLPAQPAPGIVPGVPIINVPRPAVTAPVVGTPLLAPSAIASPALLQAVAELPLLPGTVIPSQVLAVPQFSAAPGHAQPVVPPVLTPAVEAQSQLQQTGATALRALVPQGLAEVLARLPPGVLLPPVTDAGRAAPVAQTPVPAAPQPAAPAATSFASLPVLLTLPPGANATVQIISITPPPALQAAVPAITTPVTSQPVSQPAVVPAASGVQAAATPVIARPINSLALPLNHEPASPSFTTVVVGQTAQREPVATSPAGLFVLDSRSPLPVGTQVELSLVNVTEPPLETEPGLVQRTAQDWPALQQALAGMAGVLAGSAATSRLVRPEAAGNSILFILAALRIGNVQALTSDATLDALRTRGQIELLSRMNAEFQQMGQNWTRPEASASEWKTLLLPLMPQGQLTRFAIHTRQEREVYSPEAALHTKRLVVELELSRLGPLLLDGYIRHKSMDMTLRSQRMLSRELKDELRLAYRDTLTSLGWSGGMEFQTAAELWLKG